MEKYYYIVLGISLLTSIILVFLYRSASRERDFFMKLEDEQHRKAMGLQFSLERERSGLVNDHIPDIANLEARNKSLQDQLTLCCGALEQQRGVINNLKTLLSQSQARNRMQKGRK